ncbi:MAG: alpha-L-fucosidase, partial [Luteolibacter sp.]
MKIAFRTSYLVVQSIFFSIATADVLIDSNSGNGGFLSPNTGFNGSPPDWTAQNGAWIADGNSNLDTLPFGSDSAPDSHFVQLHNDAGDSLSSAVTFTVAVGDTINLSFDRRVGGAGNQTTLTVSLWDSRANETFATLGTFSTADGPTDRFVQADLTYNVTQPNEHLRLRFSISNAGGLGRDFHLDRIHLSGGVITPPTPIDYAYPHYIEASAGEEVRIEKAAKILPKPKQVDWQRLEDTFFIHFGPNTFSGREWGTGFESPTIFNPTALDAAQWVDVVKQAGGKLLILVVKHHEGFCLYPSRYTTHDVASSPWLGGNGDVLRAVSDACAAAGIKLGVYLSPADLYQIESPFSYANGSGYYGNGSAVKTSTIPTD